MKRTILRWTLRLGPAEWREEFGADIEADFEEGVREARARGRLSAVPGLLHGVSAMDLPTYAGVAALLRRWCFWLRSRPHPKLPASLRWNRSATSESHLLFIGS